MSNKVVISLSHVVKSFKNTKVLDDISLTFEASKIHGLIGRNGSGKTVLLKCICGFYHLDQGEILVNGKKIHKEIETPQSIGVLIERPGFLPHCSAYSNLKFLASLEPSLSSERIEKCLNIVGLSSSCKKHVSKYSLGMKQKLGIAQAIMDDPDILILDEPTNGLDNSSLVEVRQLLSSLRLQGKTIILASHSREDISVLCDTVHEIDKGKIIEKK